MHIHFIGIGGIGTSALAKYYLAQGYTITGSDLVSSEITKELEREGVKISIGKHTKNNVPGGADCAVATSAVKKTNGEWREALRRGIGIQHYPEALGELTREHKTITVSGSHGKSTTTALTALVLEEGYCDPTVIIGTKLKEFGNSNFRRGRGGYLVLEADEWNKSFLHYSPRIAVVTNIDAEHLDTYKTVEGVERTFEEYLSRVPGNGVIVANQDDPRLARVAKKFGKRVRWYSRAQKDAGMVRSLLKIPGEHNVSNALAALSVGRILGIHEPLILYALARYRGAWRRFEWKGMIHGAYLYSDYGHHPAEISATLAAARAKFPYRRVWCVYQPHQYRRLSYLWRDFISAFDLADRVCLLPVYDVAGRETKRAKTAVSSAKLSDELCMRGKHSSYADSFDSAKEIIRDHVRPGDVVLMMGAGDIYSLIEEMTAEQLLPFSNRTIMKSDDLIKSF